VAYLAAAMIIAGVALFVAVPLGGGFFPRRQRGSSEVDRERLEHERGLAVQGLRELEFDREMGKLSESDYKSLYATLEQRALKAMAALERFRVYPPRGKGSVRRIESARGAVGAPRLTPREIKFCPQCGARCPADSQFCGECGVRLRPRDHDRAS
jgi:NADH pyrophosphatase NudC (nudix superfamily)